MAMQRRFFFVGILLLIFFMMRVFLSIFNRDVMIVEIINWGSLVYMAFIISYLYPQFKENDERSKQIKQKGMYYTIFIILLTLIALNLLIQFDILVLSALEVVRILISLVIVTFWTTWLILSKRM